MKKYSAVNEYHVRGIKDRRKVFSNTGIVSLT